MSINRRGMEFGRSIRLAGGVALALGLSTAFGGSALAADLYYTSNTPATHPENAITAKAMFEQIKEGTGGEHNVQISPGAVLAAAGEVLKSVGSGSLETGYVVYSYTPADLPVLNFLGSMYTQDNLVGGPAMTETILLNCEDCVAEQDAANVRMLINATTDNYVFICANAGVETLADLQGKRVRGVGTMNPLIQGLGAAPVNIAYTEIYEALQRGAADCTLLQQVELEGTQLWEVAKHVTDAPAGTFNAWSLLTVNKDFWQGMSPEFKRVWLDASAGALAGTATQRRGAAEKIVEAAKSQHGVTFHEPSAELVDAITKFRAEERGTLIAAAQSRGIANAEKIADTFQASVDKWQGIVDGIGPMPWNAEQEAQYLAAIKTEIYDKVPTE